MTNEYLISDEMLAGQQTTRHGAAAYLHVERYTPRPVGLAEVRVYQPPSYHCRGFLLTATQLLALYRELRCSGPVRLHLEGRERER